MIFDVLFIEGMIHRQIAGHVLRPWVPVVSVSVSLFSMDISMLSVVVMAHHHLTLVCMDINAPTLCFKKVHPCGFH